VMEALPVCAKQKFDDDDYPVWMNLMPGKQRFLCLFAAFLSVYGHKGKDTVKEVKEVFATFSGVPIDKAGESGNPPIVELIVRFKDGSEWDTHSKHEPEWFDVNDKASLERMEAILNECKQMVEGAMTPEQDG